MTNHHLQLTMNNNCPKYHSLSEQDRVSLIADLASICTLENDTLRSLDITISRFRKILQKHLHRELSDFEFGFSLCNIANELDSLLGKSRESHKSLNSIFQEAQPIHDQKNNIQL